MEAIANWNKSGRDYEEGILLLEKLGGHSALVRLLRKGKTSFAYSKMCALLDVSSFTEPNPASIQDKSSSGHHLTQSNARTQPKLVPHEVEALNSKRKDLFAEAATLHTELRLLEDPEQCHSHASRILEIQEELAALWKKINHFEEHGSLPEVNEIEVAKIPPIELYKSLANARSNISKTKKKLEAAEEPDLRLKLKARLDTHLATAIAITQQIEEHGTV